MTNTTYEGVLNFMVEAAKWLAANGETEKPKTKFGYALHKMKAKAEKVWARYQAKLEDLRIDHCAVGEGGVILSDEKGSYQFTKDGARGLNKANETLRYATPVEIEPHFATGLPKETLTPAQEGAFIGFVIETVGEWQPESEVAAQDETAAGAM